MCDAYQQAKIHELPYQNSCHVSSFPLELVESSLCTNIMLDFLDDYNKFYWIYLLKHKYEVEHAFLQF